MAVENIVLRGEPVQPRLIEKSRQAGRKALTATTDFAIRKLNGGRIGFIPERSRRNDGSHIVLPFPVEKATSQQTKIDFNKLNTPIPVEELTPEQDPFYSNPQLQIHLGRRIAPDGTEVMKTRDKQGNLLPKSEWQVAEAKVPWMKDVLPLADLLRRKVATGQRVVFVIPGRDEGIPDKKGKSNMRTTLENLSVLRQKYIVDGKEVSLVDKFIIADNSTKREDKTRELAAEFGVRFVDVTAETRKKGWDPKDVKGKGVNMLIATEQEALEIREENQEKPDNEKISEENEIIAYVDSDFGVLPGQAMSTISTLIEDPNTQLNLLWMLRRTYAGDHEAMQKHKDPKSGGRATAFALKPMLRKYFPNLQVVQQAICGAYAIRLSAVIDMPFEPGYGIETQIVTTVDKKNRLRNQMVNREIDAYNRQLLVRHRAGDMTREEYMAARKERIPNHTITQTAGGLKVQEGQDNNAIARMADTILQVGLRNAAEEGKLPKEQPNIVEYPLHNHNDPVHGDRIIVDQKVVPLAMEQLEAIGRDPQKSLTELEKAILEEEKSRQEALRVAREALKSKYIPLFDPEEEYQRLMERKRAQQTA